MQKLRIIEYVEVQTVRTIEYVKVQTVRITGYVEVRKMQLKLREKKDENKGGETEENTLSGGVENNETEVTSEVTRSK